jgi:hypothetical protein
MLGMAQNPDACDLLCLDLPKAERVRKELPGAEELELWAAGAKALGDPTRLAVALALEAGEVACVCDLAWIVGRDERLVSHHVRLVMYELTDRGHALLVAVAEQAIPAS